MQAIRSGRLASGARSSLCQWECQVAHLMGSGSRETWSWPVTLKPCPMSLFCHLGLMSKKVLWLFQMTPPARDEVFKCVSLKGVVRTVITATGSISFVHFPTLELDWNETVLNMHKGKLERQLNGRDGLPCCSCRGPEFSSQRASWVALVTLASGDPASSSGHKTYA